MRYAADLHLHSRHSAAVSKHMTIETIARFARIKGIDLIGTGDCLQGEWLATLETSLVPAEEGWFRLRGDSDDRVLSGLSPKLRRELRFVLCTEVSCAPPGTERLGGLHHLLYFPSFEHVHRFRKAVAPFGDLREGRPSLVLNSRELLEMALEQGCPMAPAHVLNPYFSTLGTNENRASLEEVFDGLGSQLMAIETGLTSTPPMCRRLSTLDGHGLFSNSDAHSPENIGRECTILETEPGFAPMIEALGAGTRPGVVFTLKFPLALTRYYLNRCAPCAASFEGARCPQCGGRLVMGSRDRLERIADRNEPVFPGNAPGHRELLPLRQLLARTCRRKPDSKVVERLYASLIRDVGTERFLLTYAAAESFRDVSVAPAIIEAILTQRSAGHRFAPYNGRPAEAAEIQPALL